MKTGKTILFLCGIFVLLSGCGNRNKSDISKNDLALSNETDTEETDEDDGDRFYYIDFKQFVKNGFADEFTINSIAKDISFIPLETTDESLLRIEHFKIAKINEHYYISSGFVFNFSGIMEFDGNGRYIKHLLLKHRGNGPNELPLPLHWSYNTNTQLLVISTAHQILFHSFENNTTNKYTLGTDTYYECLLNDGTMVSLPDWTSLSIKGKPDIPYLHFRNLESEIIKSICYPEKRDIAFTTAEDSGPIDYYNLFPHSSGDALFRDVFSDTIQRIRSMDDIKPYMVLYRGDLAVTPKDAANRARQNQLIYLNKILETKRFFFIRYGYRNEWNNTVWDKKTLSFIANTKADNSDEHKIVISGEFYNNAWNFTKYISPTGKEMLIPILTYIDGKLYSVIDAEQAMEFVPGIVYDDNPVLMIIDID